MLEAPAGASCDGSRPPRRPSFGPATLAARTLTRAVSASRV